MYKQSRRSFLSRHATLGFAGSLSGLTGLQLGFVRQASAAQAFGDYKALVCILLAGGNDAYNMVVPYDTDQLTQYSNLRSGLALPAEELLPLAGVHNGRQYALHPGMSEVQALFNGGDLALMANVGPLVDYVDAAAIANGAPVPLGVHSHSDQIKTWQTAVPYARVAQGWGGRLADVMTAVNPANGVSMNVSLSGNNVFQSGAVVTPYSIDTSDAGVPNILGYDDPGPYGDLGRRAIEGLLESAHDNLLREAFRNRFLGTLEARETFVAALSQGTPVTTEFSADPFAQSLRQIARVIGARDQLGAVRQTFFITVGGWDHHDDLLDNQALMLPGISRGLAEFRQALVELDVFDAVTTFTTSDFGRTLTSNGDGSDHGWGGHHLVMGGSVDGGRFFGEYPELSAASPLDVGRGIYVPTMSVDEYFADLALWFGLDAGDLETVLPNIRTFYTPGSANPPLGLFARS